jgi:hypothetical protein
MDHSEATNLRATERYVLGDLSVSEVEEFERHFFDCHQCSEELMTLNILQDNARAAFLEQGPRPFTASLPAPEAELDRAGWWQSFKQAWLAPRILAPALAAVVLALLAGYESGVRSHSAAPQMMSEYALYAASRGEPTMVTPPAGAPFYSLYMDRTWERDFPGYRAAFLDESNRQEFTLPVPPPASGREMHVWIPAGALAPGRHVLVIFGLDGAGRETEAARYPFTLRFE